MDVQHALIEAVARWQGNAAMRTAEEVALWREVVRMVARWQGKTEEAVEAWIADGVASRR